MGKSKKPKYLLPDTSTQRTTSGLTASAGEIKLNDYDEVTYPDLIQDYIKMRNGDCIASATLEILKLPILAAQLQITHPDGDKATERTKQAIDYLQYTFNNLYNGFNYFKRHLLLALDYGHIMFEKVWSKASDFRGKTTNLLTFLAPIQSTTIKDYVYDDKMNFSGIKHTRLTGSGSSSEIELPKSELFILSHNWEFGDIRGRSILRPSRLFWKEKLNVYMASSRAATRGAGIPLITVFGNEQIDSTTLAKAQEIARTLGNSNQAYAIQHKDKLEVSLLGLQNQENNIEFLNYSDRQMFYSTLTEFMTSGIGENGSRAATSEHKAPYELSANAILAEISEAIQLLSYEILDMSFLGELNEEEYPTVSFASVGQKDLTAVATQIAQLAMSNAITITPEDESFIRNIFQLPNLDIKTIAGLRVNSTQGGEFEKKKSAINAGATGL